MNIRLLKQGVVMLFITLVSLPLLAGESEPEQLVRQTADEVLNVIKTRQPEFKQDPAKLYQLVDEKVLPHFDFERMTDLALGRYKRKVKGHQKPQLVKEFRQLLVRTYGKALLDYKDEVIAYLPMRGSIDKGDVTVRTEIEHLGTTSSAGHFANEGGLGLEILILVVRPVGVVRPRRGVRVPPQ